MELLQNLNAMVSLLGAVCLSWVVLNPKIYEGVLIKTGLILMIFSLLVTFSHIAMQTENWHALWASALILRCGILLVIVGVMRRKRCFGSWHRAFDWSTKWAS